MIFAKRVGFILREHGRVELSPQLMRYRNSLCIVKISCCTELNLKRIIFTA
jgi:hypothetical protein